MPITRYSRSQLLGLTGQGPDGRVLIDLGCGARKRQGYVGLDRAGLPGVDIVCDFETTIPLDDDSVDGVWSNFFFEHVHDTVKLFQEIYRVCRKEAMVEFTVPYYQSVTQFKDPTHHSVITPETLRYFTDEKWYGSDYSFNVNFKTVDIVYTYLPPFDRLMSRKLFFLRPLVYPFILFGRRFLWNIVHSIKVTICVEK
jgi:SAM-dependent methyltransferase